MSRWLLTSAVLAAMLLPAAPAGAAHKADSMAVTSWSAAPNQFVFQVQNTGDTVIKSFVLVPGSGFTAASVVSASPGACQLTGATVACTGLSLQPGCACNPGESVYVTLSGSGDTAGSSVVQIVGAPPAATPLPTATSVPAKTAAATAVSATKTATTTKTTATATTKAAPAKKKVPLCKKGQHSTKKKPCRR